jgi:hypothetical protein
MLEVEMLAAASGEGLRRARKWSVERLHLRESVTTSVARIDVEHDQP